MRGNLVATVDNSLDRSWASFDTPRRNKKGPLYVIAIKELHNAWDGNVLTAELEAKHFSVRLNGRLGDRQKGRAPTP